MSGTIPRRLAGMLKLRRPKPSNGVVVVGSGTRFLSGISVHTVRLAGALAARRRVGLITMRQLLPTRFYPGRDRVGAPLDSLALDPAVDVLDGIDWYWLPSMLRAIAFLVRHRPAVVLLQWWTATVLHSYLVIAIVARALGSRVVIEFHEVLDTGEARLGPVRAYVGVAAPLLFRLADGYAVHSEFDRALLHERYRLGRRAVGLVPLGLFDHYRVPTGADSLPVAREAPPNVVNLLFFGVIRPYKGLEDLIAAFDAISPDEIDRYWLTVVGETWESWTLPTTLIEQSRYRSRITFVNRYVNDAELDAYLRGADAVVLPYRRSSISGPLHVAMSYGLPIVISSVGGNVEAAAGYGGILFTPPGDPEALRDALARLLPLHGARFDPPTSWEETARSYERLFAELGIRNGVEPPLPTEAAPEHPAASPANR